MNFDWNTIFWSSATMVAMIILFLIFYYIYSARAMKKSRLAMIERLDSMKPGKEVLFSGGIKGKINKVGEEYLTVEVSKGVEFTISKLAVSEVLSNKKGKPDAK